VRILSVTVKNIRMHEDRTVDFDRERTVVTGPNEAGKSTLVDAIERVLCYPHRSTAGNLDSLKPRAGGGHPEVSLRFERNGRTYEIHKVFKGAQSIARLTDQDGTVHTGDEAEEKLRKLMGFDDAQLRSPFYGWSHLWARQGRAGNDPTDSASLGSVAKDLEARLNRMSGTNTTESAKDSATFERIAAEHHENHTPTGKVISASRLGSATAELTRAREAACNAAASLVQLETAADTVVCEDSLIQESRSTLAEAENRLGEIRRSLVEVERLEKTLEVRRGEAESVARDYAALEKGDTEIAELSASIDSRTQALAPQEEEILRLRTHEQQLQSAVAVSVATIENANLSQRRVAAEEDLLKTVARVFELEASRSALEVALAQIEAHQCDIAALDARLSNLPDVDKTTVEAIEHLDRQLEVVQGKLAASATRLEVLHSIATVVVDGQPLVTGDSRLLTDPTDVSVGDGTTIRINPGSGESMLELRAEATRVAQALATRLDGLGLKDAAEARLALEKRRAEQARRDHLREKIDDLHGDNVQKHLDEIVAELRKLEAEIDRKKPADFKRHVDIAAVNEAILDLESRRSQADEAVQAAHTRFDTATRELKQAGQTRECLEQALAAERRGLNDLHVRKSGLETVHGTERKTRLESLAADRQVKRHAVEATQKALEALDPDKVRFDKDRYESTVKVTTDSINQSAVRRARAEADLQRSGTLDPYGAKATADAQLEVALRRHAEVDHRARAVNRLRELFEKRRQTMAEIVAAPLRTKVAEYLDSLFGPGSRVSVTKAGDKLEDLAVARPSVGGLQFEFEELSGGTKEQVAAACRLAMAEVIAAGGNGDIATMDTCLPMVFDDAFVNSDPARIEAVQRVLFLASRRGLQIIVLSCNPKEYANFAAKRVDLPAPSHAASATPVRPPASPPAGNDGVDDESPDTDSPITSIGQRPEDNDESLSAQFLSSLEAMPDSKAGNTSLRSQLGWDDDTYERIKELLVAAGRIEKGRGRGGSVRRIDDSDPAA
jgi:DNA repair exonuclease SbcCD ATPase subunit